MLNSSTSSDAVAQPGGPQYGLEIQPLDVGTRPELQAPRSKMNVSRVRAILGIDPFQYWLTSTNAPLSAYLQVGRWRLWVEDQLIAEQDFWIPHTTPS